MSHARVYIIDEHPSIRTALAERLSHASGLEVVGHAGDLDRVKGDVQSMQPDVVLLEVKRSDGMGLELLRELSAMPGAPQIVVLTSYPSSWEEEAASRAGASSYWLKDIDTEELIRRISSLVRKLGTR